MAYVEKGKKAPHFSATDQNETTHSLAECKGSWVLLYFYLKDDTSGCTQEACMLRDDFPSFKKLGIQVFGVSADSEKSHKKLEDL